MSHVVKRWARRLSPRWLWQRLRTWRMRRVLAGFTPYTAEHAYAGVRLKIRITDPLARGWYDHDWNALPEIDLLSCKGRLVAGARVFDVGAHQGVVAMLLARRVGPSGEVVAVEALPHNARMCEVNRDLNGLRQVRVESAAVADRAGELEVCIDLNAQVKNAGTDIGTVRVRSVTLDGLAEAYGPPDVLFVDVEGYECHAFRGAARTLAGGPDCFIEVHAGCGLELAGGSVDELFDHLPPRHYTFAAWTEQAPTPFPVTTPRECPPGRFFLVAHRRSA
jgi:FkbM family methyltransferase